IGRTGPDRSVGAAAERGALFLAGGAWAVALAWAMRLVRRDRPLAERTAACYDALSQYLASAHSDLAVDSAARGFRPTPETRVRSAIADARQLALETRQRQSATSPAVQHLVVLIELADRIFSHAAADAELRAGSPASSVLADGARAVSRALLGHAPPAAIAEATSALDRATATRERGVPADASAELPASMPGPAGATAGEEAVVLRLLAPSIANALRLADGDRAASSTPAPAADPLILSARRTDHLIAPLAAIFDRRSIVTRHALRY